MRYVEADKNPPYKYENQQHPSILFTICQPTVGRDIGLAFHLLIVACSGIIEST